VQFLHDKCQEACLKQVFVANWRNVAIFEAMKHLPNLLTLCNLFCGCVAIAYILTAEPYTAMNVLEQGITGLPTWQWVYGKEQLCMGGLFIFIAGIFDLLDGTAARLLKVYSPIGKDLDSLADVVSFGVAPAALLYKFLWDAIMGQKNAFEVSIIGMAPAFLLACFAALRLAKFNVTASEQRTHFTGMPTPAVGIFVASLPLALWFSPAFIGTYVSRFLQSQWGIYLAIALLCWFMVSRIRFIKLMPAKFNLRYAWPQAILLVATVGLFFVMGFAVIPAVFILYILLSLVYQYPAAEAVNA
jgi:CDP-diacylglycerol---serine O-phosphatidyltransferase